MSSLNVHAGDVCRRNGSKQHSAYIWIRSVDVTHAYPVPVVRSARACGWARTHGRSQAIGLSRFTEAHYTLIATAVVLPSRELS